MAETTSFLGLYKPGGGSTGTNTPDETVDIDKINNNMDLIDDWAQSFLMQPVTAWTPSLSGFSLGNGTLDARYRRSNGLVLFIIELTWGSTSSASGSIGFSVPVTLASSATMHVGTGVWARQSGTQYPVQARITGGSTITASLFNSSAPIVSVGNLSNAYPAAPTAGDRLYLQGSVEAG
jgi:hypothetical protein|tara:strand:- start:21351 stop:21887 length:537 start_codon:yes stop_codon:yes gene_type:complete